jgi:hypothetical protein
MCNYKLWLLLLLTITTSCNIYQKHFGGKSHDYKQAKVNKPLKTTKEFPINKSDRYAIPKTPGEWSEPITNIAPPDYDNKSTD